MRTTWIAILMLGIAATGEAKTPPARPALPVMDAFVSVTDFNLDGDIEGENIALTLTLNVKSGKRDGLLPLVMGDVAYLAGEFPKGAELIRRHDLYLLRLPRLSKPTPVSFSFGSRSAEEGDWRRTRFVVPAASTRKLSVTCDRDDLEIQFPGALDVQRRTTDDGKAHVTAFLGITEFFEVAWKPEIRGNPPCR